MVPNAPADSQRLLASLGESELFKSYARAYTGVTGMVVRLRSLETWRPVRRRERRGNQYCALMAEQNQTCAACLRTQDRLARAAAHRPATLACPYGLMETAVPLKLGSRTIGLLQSGHVLPRSPTPESFQRAVAQATKFGTAIDNDRVRNAYFATPVVAPQQLARATELLAIFADHLSLRSNQLVLQATHAEPEAITRAKEYIRQHSAEELTLGQVARAVHMSLFHFCKLFHKASGSTFTEFVARTRIEQAKTFLLKPHRRISEIAFEVGFQSLTHFNRVFRKITGESPTQYRAHLPTGPS